MWGSRNNLVATGADFWERIDDRPKTPFDEAAAGAIAQEDRDKVGGGGRALERLAHLLSRGRRSSRREQGASLLR